MGYEWYRYIRCYRVLYKYSRVQYRGYSDMDGPEVWTVKHQGSFPIYLDSPFAEPAPSSWDCHKLVRGFTICTCIYMYNTSTYINFLYTWTVCTLVHSIKAADPPSRALFFSIFFAQQEFSRVVAIHKHRSSNKIQNRWNLINAESQNARRLAFAAHIKAAFAQARLGKGAPELGSGSPWSLFSTRYHLIIQAIRSRSNGLSLANGPVLGISLHQSDALIFAREWEAPERTSLSCLRMSIHILTQRLQSPFLPLEVANWYSL